MAKILSPNKNYSGVSASVKFTQGVGFTEDPRLISWFKSKCYMVIEDKEKDPEQVKLNLDETLEETIEAEEEIKTEPKQPKPTPTKPIPKQSNQPKKPNTNNKK